jgi:hypothetical protein
MGKWGSGWRTGVCILGVLVAGCPMGPSGGGCPDGEIEVGNLYGPSTCRPSNECRSWSIFVAPGYAGAGEPHLVPDRSATPVRADLEVGARMYAGVDFVGLEPPGCTDGVLAQGATWRTGDVTLLRVDEAHARSATFLALAPGTVRVFADGLKQAAGRAGPVELSICADPADREKNCARVPLEIRVIQ